MKSPFETSEPGYEIPDTTGEDEVSREEATRMRMRAQFKNKLKSLTLRHHGNQEYCSDCDTLPPSPMIGPSILNLRRTSTTATLGPQPKVSRRMPTHEERSYGFSSESTEYFKAHPELSTRGPNPKRIPHDEMGNIMACFTDLHVAHEIAINRCFRLKPINDDDVPENKEMVEMKKVFWQLFKEEVGAKKSPCNQTLAMMSELKDAMHSLMMPHNHDLREQVNQVLDLERMRQEVVKSRFDYDCYSQYILDVLLQICCPSRDKEIEQIRGIKEPVESFQRIFQLVEDMKDDMENFFIALFRPSIVKMSIENERKKFADYLELEYRLHEDGLRATRSWLMRHRVGVRDTLTVIAKAYGEILYWTTNEPWPETMMEDIERFQKLGRQLDRIGIVGGVILEVGKVCQKIFKNPPPGLRILFSKYMKLLIPQAETEDEAKLVKCLERAGVKAVEATEIVITKYMGRAMRPEEKNQIYNAVLKVQDKDNHFRCLILRRTVDYAEEVIIAAHDYHTAVPSTLTGVMYEVAILISEFHRIILHNRGCFEELYRDICEDLNKAPLFPEENDGNWDNGLLDTLKKLRSRIATPKEAEEIARRASELRLKLKEEEQYLESVFGEPGCDPTQGQLQNQQQNQRTQKQRKKSVAVERKIEKEGEENNSSGDKKTNDLLNITTFEPIPFLPIPIIIPHPNILPSEIKHATTAVERRLAELLKEQNKVTLQHETFAFTHFCNDCKQNRLEIECSVRRGKLHPANVKKDSCEKVPNSKSKANTISNSNPNPNSKL